MSVHWENGSIEAIRKGLKPTPRASILENSYFSEGRGKSFPFREMILSCSFSDTLLDSAGEYPNTYSDVPIEFGQDGSVKDIYAPLPPLAFGQSTDWGRYYDPRAFPPDYRIPSSWVPFKKPDETQGMRYLTMSPDGSWGFAKFSRRIEIIDKEGLVLAELPERSYLMFSGTSSYLGMIDWYARNKALYVVGPSGEELFKVVATRKGETIETYKFIGGKLFYIVEDDWGNTGYLVDLELGGTPKRLPFLGDGRFVFSADGETIANYERAADRRSTLLRLFDFSDPFHPELLWEQTIYSRYFRSLKLSSEGSYVAFKTSENAERGQSVRLRALDRVGDPVMDHRFPFHQTAPNGMEFLDDNSLLLGKKRWRHPDAAYCILRFPAQNSADSQEH